MPSVSSAAPDVSGRIPLLIGVTGHRDLRDSDRPTLETKVRAILEEQRRNYPHTPLILLSPLAEGADRLAARVALDLGVRLYVPLPVSRDSYMADFQDAASRDEFNALAARADAVYVLTEKCEENAPRDECYKQVGRFVAEHCQILIALWDGVDADKVGGTSDIVDWRLKILPREATSQLHPPDPVRSGPVYQIITPRQGSAEPANAFAVLRRFPESSGHESTPEQIFREAYSGIDRFNKSIAAGGASLSEAAAQSRAQLLPDIEAEKLPNGLRITRQCFAVADALAGKYRSRTLGSHRWIFILVFLAVCGYELSAHVFHREVIGFFIYPLVLGIAYAVYLLARRRNYQDRYHDFRALAEGLRIQFYWRLAGLDLSVEEFYLRRQRREMNWVRAAIRDCWSLQRGDPPTIRIDLVREYWLKNQLEYFTQRAPQEHARERRYKIAIRVSLGIGLVLAVALAVLRGKPTALGENWYKWIEDHHQVEELLILFSTLPMVLSALLHNYRERIELGSHVKQYKVMGVLFATAWNRLSTKNSNESVAADQAVIEELGREALVENGDWVLMLRDRPLIVPHAK